MPKIELIVPVKARAGKTQALREQISSLLQPTRAEEGCEFYRAYESKTEGHFFFHELWTTQQDLDRTSSPYTSRDLPKPLSLCSQSRWN